MDLGRLLMLTPRDSFVAKRRKKWLVETGVWEKIICLIQPAIARLLCERIEQSRGRGFDGTKSGSVIFFLHFYLKSLPSQPILHFAHLFSPFLSRPGFRKLFCFFEKYVYFLYSCLYIFVLQSWLSICNLFLSFIELPAFSILYQRII
jgi:hypothetical protein